MATETRVICPQCQAAGLTSTVEEGWGSTTDMHFPPFLDEEGRRHVHDGNRRSSAFECSHGHSFRGSDVQGCWCGWPDRPEDTPRPRPARDPAGLFGSVAVTSATRLGAAWNDPASRETP